MTRMTMMDAPERIWIMPAKDQWARGTGEWMAEFWGLPTETPYILDTPEALAKSPAVQALVKAAVKVERERCARLVEKRAEDYDRDFGIYDYSTGVTEYPGTGSESMEEWESIAAAIRAEVPK